MAKSEFYIQPSPAIKVPSSQAIYDCILMMKKLNVGSLLIVDEDSQTKIVGIFTERDILSKFSFIQNYENLKLPIRSVMTSPVKTLDISALDQAGPMMIKSGIRHLPVTMKSDDGKSSLVGVISMRDVLKRFLEGPPPEPNKDLKLQILVLSTDPNLTALARKLCPKGKDLSILSSYSELETTLNRLKQTSSGSPATKALIDIEYFQLDEWIQAARHFNADPNNRGILFCVNRIDENKTIITTLNQLNKSQKILVLSKPINVLALSDFLTRDTGEFLNLSKEK